MNALDALERLQAMTQYSVAPELTTDELDILLTFAAIADEDGLQPDDDDYVPTYAAVALNAAAAEGWRWKAGKVDGVKFSADGFSIDPGATVERLLKMADYYAKRGGAGSFILSGRTSRFENILSAQTVVN
jgi:hypothetical protein